VVEQLWDLRVKGSVKTFSEDYQVTAVAFADASDKVYTGGIDNTVRVWDLRKDETVMQLKVLLSNHYV
jgi:Prp8 binding protein